MNHKNIKHHCLVCEKLSSFEPEYIHTCEAADGCEEEYSIATCTECNEVAVFYRQDIGLVKEMSGDEPSHIRAFPLKVDNRSLSFCAPASVTRPYYDAVHAEGAELWGASAVMLGKSLEAVCRHFYPDAKSAFEGLNLLYANGLLSKKMLEWGHDLRVLRNVAAHSHEIEIGSWDVSVAFDFFRALIIMLFEIDLYVSVYKQAKSKHEAKKSFNGNARQ